MEDITNIGGPSLSQTEAVKCEKCGCEVFTPAYMIRKVSRLLIGAKQDGIMPIDTFVCVKCGHVNKEFLPPELANKKQDEIDSEQKEQKTSNLIL